jgi:L-asparaginase
MDTGGAPAIVVGMAPPPGSKLSSSRPRVTVLATGGTIAGSGSSRSRKGYRSGVFSIEALIAAAPGIETLATLRAEHVASIGSQDMGEAVWRALALRTQRALDERGVDGVVVTHWTDTMEETA